MTTDREMLELRPYLDGMRAATTPDDLEAAFQKDRAYQKHGFRSRGMRAIEKVLVEEGVRLCVGHPHGHLVPRYDERRRLEVNGETYRVARGGNSTGVRYAWCDARDWAIDAMTKGGLSRRAAHLVWNSFRDYPHRALQTVEKAMTGEIPDPQLDVPVRSQHPGNRPISLSVEENEREGRHRRASRACTCGGTLFDWGCGHHLGFEFVEWRCNACPDVFTEHMTRETLYALRQGAENAIAREAPYRQENAAC